MTDAAAATNDITADAFCNITEVIEAQAQRHPAALAIIGPERVLSYRELVGAVRVIGRKLLDSGVKPGQVLGVSMAQTPLHLLTLLAIARIGAVSVPAHAALPRDRRLLAAQRFGAVAIVSGRADMQIEGLPFISLADLDLTAAVPPLAAAQTRAIDPCWISLSSGTSGDPKGVLRSHGYMLDRVDKSTYERTPQSRLMPMDLNFGVGFGQAMRMLVAGGAVVLAPDNLPASFVHMVRAHAVTHWLLSPAWAEDILPLLQDDDIHFPSLVHLLIIGAPPGKRLLDAMFKKFTPNVYMSYGISELGPVALATPEILQRVPSSVGKILPWVQAEIVDARKRRVAAGKSGRLRLKLDSMFEAYHLDEQLSAERFHDGWYYPHDNARIDAEGLLYIEGREDDVLNIGGGKVHFRDVETAIEAHPSVREAAVFKLSDASGRDALAAAVIVTKPVPLAELMAWASEKLGPICPEKLVLTDALPRTATGKVLRDQLATLFATQLV